MRTEYQLLAIVQELKDTMKNLIGCIADLDSRVQELEFRVQSIEEEK